MHDLPETVYIDTCGCPENRFDVGQLKHTLEQLGVEVTRTPQDADTIIVNTCGLTHETEAISIDIIKKVKRLASPGTRILVTGCLPIINPTSLKNIPDIELIRGPTIHSFPWKIPDTIDLGSLFSPTLHPQRIILGKDEVIKRGRGLLWNIDRLMYRRIGICPEHARRFFIKIASGCNRYCTFCAVRISRGPLQSKPIPWVVERFREGLESGYREFSLIGTNVSAYGQDIGANLPELLNELLKIEGRYKLCLRNLEPEDIIEYLDDFLEVLKTGKIKYIELPLESGSDRILKLMNRAYTVDQYVDALRRIKKACPALLVRSQVMIGFPTETEEDFQKSVEWSCKLPFVYVEPFCYSPRPGTAASRLENQVPAKVAKRRYKLLRKKLMKSHLLSKFRYLIQSFVHLT